VFRFYWNVFNWFWYILNALWLDAVLDVMVAEDWTIIKADFMIELAWSDNCFVIFKPCYISFVIVAGWDVEPRKVSINHESVIKAEAAA
jgi:hypothetical protein